jgi:hypothetical protein
MPMDDVQIVSYGGGVNTAALLILNLTGRVENPARVAVFADTGGESPQTYRHIELMSHWAQKHGGEIVVRRRPEPLYDFIVNNRGPAIPVRMWPSGAMGRRICTQDWKIQVINRFLHEEMKAEKATQQLGISWDEVHRARPSRAKWLTSRFPLVDLGLTRSDCLRIIAAESLPLPPKSSCFFCPLHRVAWWQYLASYVPELFSRAVALENSILAWREKHGLDPAYLSSRLEPLDQVATDSQLPMFDEVEDVGFCDAGYCFV